MKMILLVFLYLLLSCSNNAEKTVVVENDTLTETHYIGRNDMTGKAAGSAHASKMLCFFVVNDTDSSQFRPIFGVSSVDKKVWLNLNMSYSHPNMLYDDRMHELGQILPVAAEEFDFDSLTSMALGRLLLQGDLAVTLSTSYQQEFSFGEQITTEEYPQIAAFLLESKLTRDINDLMKPFGLRVHRVSVEKVLWADKTALLQYNMLKAKATNIPDKILDALVWVELTKIPPS